MVKVDLFGMYNRAVTLTKKSKGLDNARLKSPSSSLRSEPMS